MRRIIIKNEKIYMHVCRHDAPTAVPPTSSVRPNRVSPQRLTTMSKPFSSSNARLTWSVYVEDGVGLRCEMEEASQKEVCNKGAHMPRNKPSHANKVL